MALPHLQTQFSATTAPRVVLAPFLTLLLLALVRREHTAAQEFPLRDRTSRGTQGVSQQAKEDSCNSNRMIIMTTLTATGYSVLFMGCIQGYVFSCINSFNSHDSFNSHNCT